MRNLTILLSDTLPDFHGQFATCGDWRQATGLVLIVPVCSLREGHGVILKLQAYI
jgi:hypothetical protein